MDDPPSRVGLEMDEAEISDLLQSKGHGVLSMGLESRGYGLPISYTYDRDADRLFLGLVKLPGSKKTKFATNTDEVTLNVYQYDDVDAWKSVIVTGEITEVDPERIPDRVADLFFETESRDSTDPELSHLGEFDRTWYELDVSDISGRHSG